MKILFENKLLDDNAVLSSDVVSSNYPLSNLKNRVLTRRSQVETSGNDLVIEISLTEAKTINCLGFSYTNGEKISVVIDSVSYFTDKDIDYRTNMLYFDDVEASLIEVTISGSEDYLYLGGLAIGEVYTMPDPLYESGEGLLDNNALVSNTYGISYQTEGAILENPAYSFAGLSRATRNELREVYPGLGSIVWLDAFEDSTNFEEPLYCTISTIFTFTPNARGTYQMETAFQEAN